MAHEVVASSENARGHRHSLYLQLDPQARSAGLSIANKVIVALILCAVASAVLETEPTLTEGFEPYWKALDGLILAVFTVEYFVRLWVSVENPAYGPGLRGRFRYFLSAYALVDLAVLFPTLVLSAGSETFLLRLVRVMRILQLARLGRLSRSIDLISSAIKRRSMELLLSLGIAMLVVLLSSTCLYLLEANLQPTAFGSIPRAMWWAVTTLTTVGYGDVYPLTILGRLFAAVTAISGIALVAMPAGILASAFSDAMAERRRSQEN